MRRSSLAIVLLRLLLPGSFAAAAGLEEAQNQYLSGDYRGCVASIEKEIQDGAGGEERYLLLSKALLASGRYPEALKSMTNALRQEPDSIRLRWQAREVFLGNGEPERAGQMADEIVQRVSSDPRTYRDPASLVVFGQAALLKNADPKRVLDQLFDAARKADPKLREVYLAGGELALEKHDFALAAKKFEEGLKQLPEDADLHYGLARAYAPSDQALMAASLEAALERNSNHVGSLLLLAERAIDAEEYPEADRLLEHVKLINEWQPEAWAYRAVLAHLRNLPAAETSAREAGLKFWPANPQVDYFIGLKLSQKYRFAEGAGHQRQALQFDPEYLPAKAQLAQDLLRLGEETEGWKLAQQVQKEDGYDVEAYNLVNLHQTMGKFATVTNEDFLIRMSAREAALYGSQVLELLTRARSNLCAKYGMELKRPTIVEIFPEQKDFAVRTFGMPGNPGYLGVCFGTVVTANSPAVQHGHPINWQAVLWHEFCHVVTLQMTRNKMPRWLSEGISVYEESQANPSWGQHMKPDYREMALGDELTPVSRLSAAFLSPKSEHHLQFAYYESSLVVEFLVKRYGLEKLKAILRELSEGVEINQALARHIAAARNEGEQKVTGSKESDAASELKKANGAEDDAMEEFENEFAEFARERAENLAPGLDWEKPESEKDAAPHPHQRKPPTRTDEESWEAWAKTRPTNFWVMTRQAEQMVEEKQWPEVKIVAQRLLDLYPDFTGPDSPYRMLAAAHRALGETNAEREVLGKFAERDDEAADAYQRLMELGAVARDWPAVAQNARRYLAVNPLLASPYRFLAEASEQTGDTRGAITAYGALLELEPSDPAEVHFRLAELLHRVGDPSARRHVLQALEDAPRFQDALRLLLKINSPPPQTRASSPTAVNATP